MPKRFNLYKFCKTCEGQKEVQCTLTFGDEQTIQFVPCPHCKGKGITHWGFMEEEDAEA